MMESLFGTPIKVAVVGSRDYPDLDEVRAYVRSLPPGTIVVSGGARGVDRAAEKEARACGLPEPIIHKAEWASYRKGAGRIRNRLIAREADRMICFWDGQSTGTMDARDCMLRLKKPVEVRRARAAASA